jgi:hypothetical protein
MAVGDFAAFREDLLIAIARADREMGSYREAKNIADDAGLKYSRGWVRQAVLMLEEQRFIKASHFLAGPDPDLGMSITLTGAGWEEAERLAERRGTSVEEQPYVEIDENSPEWVAAQNALDETVSAVKASNEYAGTEPEDQKQRIAELESGKRILQAPRVRLEAVKSLLLPALRHLVTKFADTAIGMAAGAALVKLTEFLGRLL